MMRVRIVATHLPHRVIYNTEARPPPTSAFESAEEVNFSVSDRLSEPAIPSWEKLKKYLHPRAFLQAYKFAHFLEGPNRKGGELARKITTVAEKVKMVLILIVRLANIFNLEHRYESSYYSCMTITEVKNLILFSYCDLSILLLPTIAVNTPRLLSWMLEEVGGHSYIKTYKQGDSSGAGTTLSFSFK